MILFTWGFKQLIGQFNGLQELLYREDTAYEILLQYSELNPEIIIEQGEHWTRQQKRHYLLSNESWFDTLNLTFNWLWEMGERLVYW